MTMVRRLRRDLAFAWALIAVLWLLAASHRAEAEEWGWVALDGALAVFAVMVAVSHWWLSSREPQP